MIGEDADLEKGGKILNRVMHLERANHTSTPCVEEREKGIGQEATNARADRQGEDR